MFRQSKPVGGLDCVDSNVKASLILRLKECVSEIVMKYTAGNPRYRIVKYFIVVLIAILFHFCRKLDSIKK